MKKPEINLIPSEIMMAAHVGMMRQVLNIKKEIEHRHGGSQDQSWQYHLEGALGEYALAKYIDVNWSGVGIAPRAPDVGSVDVRTTASDTNRLIIHEDDKDNSEYWFVTGLNGKYKIQGWILGRDGKQKEYWEDPTKKNRWAYFVPTSKLHSPELCE